MSGARPSLDATALRESALSGLARNLSMARSARSITQEGLAEQSGVSRATIAQIESGESDPRFSTIVDLAAALEITPLLLLMTSRELAAISELVRDGSSVREASAGIPTQDVQRMRRLLESGVQRGQKQAVEMGVTAVQVAGLAAGGAASGAAIGTLLAPGLGTVLGAALGSMIFRANASRKGR
jgi:transcriptional regulator with XRE-family HTH domain